MLGEHQVLDQLNSIRNYGETGASEESIVPLFW